MNQKPKVPMPRERLSPRTANDVEQQMSAANKKVSSEPFGPFGAVRYRPDLEIGGLAAVRIFALRIML